MTPTLTPVDEIPGASNGLTKVTEIPGQEAVQLTKVDAIPGAPTLTPVDPLAPDAPIEFFQDWQKQNDKPVLEQAVEVGKSFFSGLGEAGKMIAERTKSTLGAVVATENRDEKALEAFKGNVAAGSEIAAEAYKGFATVGEYLKSAYARLDAHEAQLSPRGPEKARAALESQRTFYRTMRDLTQSSNDGRVILNAVTEAVLRKPGNTFADTPVNEEGARFVANFVDPDLAAAWVKGAVRGFVVKEAGKVALSQLPYTGELAHLEKEVVTAAAKRAEVEASIVSHSDSAGLSKLSEVSTELADANLRFKNVMALTEAQAAALEVNGKGFLQRGAGAAVDLAGKTAAKAGEVLGTVNNSIDNLLAHFAGGSEGGQVAVDAIAGKVIPGNSLRRVPENMLKQAGRDASAAGRLISATESSLPYFQALGKALPEGSVGRWTASKLENFEFLADTGRWAFDTAQSGLEVGAIGAVFGGLSGDPVAGAVQGGLFGMAGSQFGQFSRMNSQAEVNARQTVDVTLARRRAAGRGPEALKAFDRMTPGHQLLVASLEQAHPDMFVNPTSENGVSWYEFNGSVGEVGIDPKNPLAGALTHEVKHHLGRNPVVAQAVETKILGDVEAGVPGMFTELDGSGKPVVDEIPDAANPEAIRRTFRLNKDFYALREEYLQRLRDKDLPTQEYERSDKLIAHEIWAEAETTNLLGRQTNGEFDVVGMQRMGPLQRRVADAIEGSDLVANSTFLQKSLAKVGVVFDGLSGRAANTGLFSKSLEVRGMEKVLKKYYRMSDAEKAAGSDFEQMGERRYTEEEILKSPQLTELFSSGHDVIRDPVSGKLRFVGEKEAKARATEFFETLTSELNTYTGTEPGVVKAQEVVDANGRKSKVFLGTRVPESVVAKMEASKRFNETQLNNLRTFSKLLTEARGNEINFFYQPAMKRGGKLYKTRPITERTETPMTIRITQDGNVVINTISQEKLVRNLVNAIKGGKAELWGNDFQKVWADIQVYLDNHANGRAGDAGIGVEKKDFINSLFGQFTKEQREFNPFLQDISEKKARDNGIVQSRRLDRINKMFVLSTTFKPDYSKVARNFSPGAPEKIAKAALRVTGGRIFEGRTHADAYMKMSAEKIYPDENTDDGFITDRGRYVSRSEAMRIARETGQVEDGFENKPSETGVRGKNRLEANTFEESRKFSPGAKDTPLEGSLGKGDIKFTHYSGNAGLKALDPKNFGKSGITPKSEFAGLPRTYAYAEGSKLGQDKGLVDVRPNKYEGSIPKGKIYDSTKDPLGYWSMINREKADQMLVDRGFVGIYKEGGKGVKQLEFFKPVPVKGGKQFSPGTKQTETPEFKAWFGKSKVVDEGGEPLVVYHSTVAADKLTTFKRRPSDLGFHFGTRGQAEDRFNIKIESDPYGPQLRGVSHGTIPAYIKIENPLRLPDLGSWSGSNVFYALKDDPQFVGKLFSDMTSAKARDVLKAAGFDGIVYKNTGESDRGADFRKRSAEAWRAYANSPHYTKSMATPDSLAQISPEYREYRRINEEYRQLRELSGQDSYIAFEPTQIKSAIGNRGTFDPKSPDIRFSPGQLTSDQIPKKKDVDAFVTLHRLNMDEAAAYREVVQKVRDSDASALPLEPQYDKAGRPLFDVEGDVTTLKVSPIRYDFIHAPEIQRLKDLQKESPKKDFTWREKGTDLLAERLHTEATAALLEPSTQAGIGWYSKMRGWLQDRFGAGIETFSQLLGATSARTPVDENFKQAIDALKKFSRGDYDALLQRYDEHIAPIRADLEAGKIDEDVARKRINEFEDVPTRSNGKKFNANSQKVLQALYGNWLELTQGPKTPNFAGNLSGRTLKATVDVWAARTSHRLLYENKSYNPASKRVSNAETRWRILPEAETGVEFKRAIGLDIGGDFGFAQEAFQKAADKLGMEADDLQALLWFHEKHLYTERGWTKAAGKVKSSFEGEAGKLDTERFQLGVTTFTTPEDHSVEGFNKELATTRDAIANNPQLVYARVSPSSGLYGDTIEPSFDAEFVVTRGADVSPILKHTVDLGRKANQNDVFVSKVVTADHPNARPGLEIGFKASEDSAFVTTLTTALRAAGVDGFTVAVDRRGRPIGIRTQFIPEISARWADDKGAFLDEVRALDAAEAWQNKAREALKTLQPDASSRLSYGQETYFDTRVIGREEYDQAAHVWSETSVADELGRRRKALGL